MRHVTFLLLVHIVSAIQHSAAVSQRLRPVVPHSADGPLELRLDRGGRQRGE